MGLLLPLLTIVLLTGCMDNPPSPPMKLEESATPSSLQESSIHSSVSSEQAITSSQVSPPLRRVDFSAFNPSFRFAAEIPSSWKVEFFPGITALNIYDPAEGAEKTLEKSQIFIRLFEANRFLTLSTVDISLREETTVHGHDAVRYEITKKPGVAPFRLQPAWRSGTHRLIDIRLTPRSPSLFYVFAYTPSLSSDFFEIFIGSIEFHSDRESFVPALARTEEREIKKPFGIFITQEDSPIQPERFSGYHTGVDFEILKGERDEEVSVSAICGGPLLLKKQAEGYGGVAVQQCLLGQEDITVIYGHLALSSIEAKVGTYLKPGSTVGVLGKGGSDETDGERKHLHLGVHRGKDIEISGYVQGEEELADWMDPMTLY